MYISPSPSFFFTNFFKLRESIERQKYLEGVIWSQAEQIKHSSVPDKDDAINTMKSIFLMSVRSDLIKNQIYWTKQFHYF